MEILKIGAEANLYLEDGVLVKKRVSKEYRFSELDFKLRRRRTRAEAKNLVKALDAGVPVPKVFFSDDKKFILKMEYLEGSTLKEEFDEGKDVEESSFEVGKILSLLHNANIVHNDLTTSNLIRCGEKIYIIDFGLSIISHRIEDKAMDLVVFKKSIHATHTTDYDLIWNSLAEGYKPSNEIMRRVEAIEKRVRYK